MIETGTRIGLRVGGGDESNALAFELARNGQVIQRFSDLDSEVTLAEAIALATEHAGDETYTATLVYRPQI